MEDHEKQLRTVLQMLREANLVTNKKKCSFGQKQLEYLGHIISATGVSADPKKLEVMAAWPVPKEVKGLRGFLGLISLKFLTKQRLMGEEQFKWTSKLMGFDFNIRYKPSCENGVADALSSRMTYADSHPGYTLQGNKLLSKNRLVLPRTSARIPLFLADFYNSVVGGHSGLFRIYQRLAGLVYWEGYEEWQHALPIPSQVWSDISLDIIKALPKSGGKDAILFIKLVVVDHLWIELFHQAGSKLNFSSAYHPQLDGKTSCQQMFGNLFAMSEGSKPKQWKQWLAWAELWFNTNYSGSTKLMPFKALYGRDPPFIFKGVQTTSKVEDVNQLLADTDAILEELRTNLLRDQDCMKAQAEKRRREMQFMEGD
ncbi:putative mitochondrial protein, partial [Mucuna pruriens]